MTAQASPCVFCASFYTVRGVHKSDCPNAPKETHSGSEYTLDNAVRDICSVSVAPASKSEVRRIVQRLLDAHDEEWSVSLQEHVDAARREGQMNPKVGFLRQYLNEMPNRGLSLWDDEKILNFLRIPFDIQK